MANPHPSCKFPKGSNGGVRRGKSIIPSGSVRLLYRAFLHEKREDIWKALEKALKKPGLALQLVQDIGDRLEGKPKQAVEVTAKRTTIFRPAEIKEKAEGSSDELRLIS